jgi:hypothetical protein
MWHAAHTQNMRLPRASVGSGNPIPVLRGHWCAGCDLTVLLMCIATVWETIWRIQNGKSPDPSDVDGKLDSLWGVVELVFTVAFSMEVVCCLPIAAPVPRQS